VVTRGYPPLPPLLNGGTARNGSRMKRRHVQDQLFNTSGSSPWLPRRAGLIAGASGRFMLASGEARPYDRLPRRSQILRGAVHEVTEPRRGRHPLDPPPSQPVVGRGPAAEMPPARSLSRGRFRHRRRASRSGLAMASRSPGHSASTALYNRSSSSLSPRSAAGAVRLRRVRCP
jgi:hypothetical protein